MRRAEGVSLIELILVIVILGILAVFVGPVLYNAMRAYDRGQAADATQAKMRYAMERLSREIREIRRNSTNALLLDVSTMSAASLTFFKNDGREVRVDFAGGAVNLGYTGVTTGLLLDQVNGFSFAYFQPDASSVATGTSSLAFIEVSVTLTEITGGNTFSARQRIDLRDPE